MSSVLAKVFVFDAEEAEQNAVELLHLAYEFIVVFERGEEWA